MILTGPEIIKQQGHGLLIQPFRKEQVNPNSYNLRLGSTLLVYDSYELDAAKPNEVSKIEIPETGIVLQPNRVYLGQTQEYTATDLYVPMLEGRSSVGRLGLMIHITAGFGDVGFRGFWTLELHAIQPVRIYPGMEICQIYYHTTKGDRIKYSSGKYQNNVGVQPSKLWQDFENR